MRLSTFIIGILLIGTIMVAFYNPNVGIVGGLASSNYYNTPVNPEYIQKFDRTTNISREINESYGKIFSTSVDKTLFAPLVFESLSLVKNVIILPFSALGEFIDSIFGFIPGIPEWVRTFLGAIIIVIMIFLLIALIMRYRET